MKKRSSKNTAAARSTRSSKAKGKTRKSPAKKAVSKPTTRKVAMAKKKVPVKTQAGLKKKTVVKAKDSGKKAAPTAKSKPVMKKAAPVSKRKTVAPKAKRVPTSRTAAMRSVSALSSVAVMASGTPVNSINSVTSVPQVRAEPATQVKFGAVRRSPKPRLLWIGDALVPTGFATVTHAVLNHLRHDWEVVVSGVNYDGSAHDLPYQVMPAWQGGDMWGMNRFQHLCAEFDPAAVVINNDWWNVAQFAQIAPKGVPIIGYMPVDGGHLDPAAMRALNKLHAAVWYTRFGHREAVKAGFDGPGHIIPHGIDTGVFQPVSRKEARRLLDLNVPANAFIVGNINRNQPRKRLDVTVQIFADWIKQHHISDAYLLLHCAKQDTGWDLHRVAAYHGVADRLILTGGDDIRDMQGRQKLQLIYGSLDVQMTTTLGEGWGLTTMEGMACGIPQIVPDSSALAEWAVPAVKVPCSRLLIHPEINTVGALVDDVPFVAALQKLYCDKAARARLSSQGIAHLRRGEFQWKNVAGRFSTILSSALRKKTVKSRVLA
jgi:D-inositol-3-phosphate glycosyltransferase